MKGLLPEEAGLSFMIFCFSTLLIFIKKPEFLRSGFFISIKAEILN